MDSTVLSRRRARNLPLRRRQSMVNDYIVLWTWPFATMSDFDRSSVNPSGRENQVAKT